MEVFFIRTITQAWSLVLMEMPDAEVLIQPPSMILNHQAALVRDIHDAQSSISSISGLMAQSQCYDQRLRR